jgi:hypothetical protein
MFSGRTVLHVVGALEGYIHIVSSCRVSTDLQTWAVHHRRWTCSCQFARSTHRATQHPLTVSHIVWCTLPWLATWSWVFSAHRRPHWRGSKLLVLCTLSVPQAPLPLGPQFTCSSPQSKGFRHNFPIQVHWLRIFHHYVITCWVLYSYLTSSHCFTTTLVICIKEQQMTGVLYYPISKWLFLLGFEVLTAVVMKSTIFWDITPCSLLIVNQHFRGTFRLHLQGRKNKLSNKPAWKQNAAFCLLPAFMLVYCPAYFFDSEDRGDMFLRNVSWHWVDYMALYPRRLYSSGYFFFLISAV